MSTILVDIIAGARPNFMKIAPIIRAIQARGIDTLVECGPGKVLAGLCKRIDAGLTGAALYDPATLADVKGLLP